MSWSIKKHYTSVILLILSCETILSCRKQSLGCKYVLQVLHLNFIIFLSPRVLQTMQLQSATLQTAIWRSCKSLGFLIACNLCTGGIIFLHRKVILLLTSFWNVIMAPVLCLNLLLSNIGWKNLLESLQSTTQTFASTISLFFCSKCYNG